MDRLTALLGLVFSLHTARSALVSIHRPKEIDQGGALTAIVSLAAVAVAAGAAAVFATYLIQH